jgi:D-alanyl-D-alanine carboxypeptidase
MKATKFYVLLLACTLIIGGCEKEKGINSNAKVFDPVRFRNSISNQLNGALGYSMVINQNGIAVDTFSFGMGANNPSSGSAIPASVLFDINIASVTKPFTTMAAIQLLEQNGILLNFPIGPWLPSTWSVSTPMSNITFQQLFTHTSGIRQSNTSWDSLKATVSGPLEGAQTYSYSNVNLGLFRAILPKLNDVLTFNNNESNMSTTGFETWMSNNYIFIMQQRVFNQASIPNVICNVTPGVTTMQAFNELNNPPLLPRNAGDWTELCGGGGFYMTTLEMAKVMAYLVNTNNILNPAQKATMDNNMLGWDPGDSFGTSYGQAYGKDGALFWDNNGNGNNDIGDSGLQTWVGKFPNKVELALSVTSIGNGYRNLPGIIRNAYEAAWVDQP